MTGCLLHCSGIDYPTKLGPYPLENCYASLCFVQGNISVRYLEAEKFVTRTNDVCFGINNWANI